MTSSSRRCKRADVVLQQAEEGLAPPFRQVAQRQALGDVRDHAEIAAQVVRGLLPKLGPAAFQVADVVQRRFEVSHRARRLQPLEAEVLGRAFARRLADVPGERETSLGLHLRRGRMVGEVAVELAHQAQMQRSPLARDLVQVVALLPALQAMRLGIARLVESTPTCLGRAGTRDQPVGQRFEPGRQVVDQLRPWQRIAGRQVRIGGDRVPPGLEQGRNAARK